MTELYYYLGLVALLIAGWFALNATTTSRACPRTARALDHFRLLRDPHLCASLHDLQLQLTRPVFHNTLRGRRKGRTRPSSASGEV